MKKKVVSALLCATMVATMFAGCGSKESSDNATTPDTSKADTSSEVTAPAEDTGKVLNIYCWNEEFKSRITAHYPDYQEVDATHGKIGDVDVVALSVKGAKLTAETLQKAIKTMLAQAKKRQEKQPHGKQTSDQRLQRSTTIHSMRILSLLNAAEPADRVLVPLFQRD